MLTIKSQEANSQSVLIKSTYILEVCNLFYDKGTGLYAFLDDSVADARLGSSGFTLSSSGHITRLHFQTFLVAGVIRVSAGQKYVLELHGQPQSLTSTLAFHSLKDDVPGHGRTT